MRNEVGDYDQDLVELWYERGIERSSFSGRLICEELSEIGPTPPEFWASLAFKLQQKKLHIDAGDAWEIAVARCQEENERCAVLFATAHSWWDVHLEKGGFSKKTDAWENAFTAIDKASRLNVRSVNVHQWFAVLYEDVGEKDLELEHIAIALRENNGCDLDWDDFWFAGEAVAEISTYDALLRELVGRLQFEKAGEVLQSALEAGHSITQSPKSPQLKI
jgi:tetratricopeptide (TPR) repeat protein